METLIPGGTPLYVVGNFWRDNIYDAVKDAVQMEDREIKAVITTQELRFRCKEDEPNGEKIERNQYMSVGKVKVPTPEQFYFPVNEAVRRPTKMKESIIDLNGEYAELPWAWIESTDMNLEMDSLPSLLRTYRVVKSLSFTPDMLEHVENEFQVGVKPLKCDGAHARLVNIYRFASDPRRIIWNGFSVETKEKMVQVARALTDLPDSEYDDFGDFSIGKVSRKMVEYVKSLHAYDISSESKKNGIRALILALKYVKELNVPAVVKVNTTGGANTYPFLVRVNYKGVENLPDGFFKVTTRVSNTKDVEEVGSFTEVKELLVMMFSRDPHPLGEDREGRGENRGESRGENRGQDPSGLAREGRGHEITTVFINKKPFYERGRKGVLLDGRYRTDRLFADNDLDLKETPPLLQVIKSQKKGGAQWECPICDLANSEESDACEACGGMRG